MRDILEHIAPVVWRVVLCLMPVALSILLYQRGLTHILLLCKHLLSDGKREDWMSEAKDNLRSGLEEGWVKVGAARCEKCGLDIG